MITEWQVALTAPRGVSRAFDDSDLNDWQANLDLRVASGEMAENTATTYKRGVAKFRAYCLAHPEQRVGPALVREWKADMRRRGYKPSTVNIFMAGVKNLFAWAVNEGRIAYDPTRGVANIPSSRTHKREPLTDDEVRALLAQPDTATLAGLRDKAMLTLMAYTGVRSIEIQRATIGDLRSNGCRKLEIWGKGEREPGRVVLLVQPELISALDAWLRVHPCRSRLEAPLFCSLGSTNRGGALSMVSIRRIVKRYFAKAGILDPRKTTHSLRHTVVTKARRAGLNDSRIMALTGHKSVETLNIYAHEIDREEDPAELYIMYA